MIISGTLIGLIQRSRDKIETFVTNLKEWERDPQSFATSEALTQRITAAFEGMIQSMVTNENRVGPVYITRDVLLTDAAGRQLSSWITQNYQLVPRGLVFNLERDQSFHDLPDVRLQTRGLADRTLRFEKDDVVNLKVLPVYTTMLINRGRYLATFNQYDRAAALFSQALALDPELAAAQQGLAESTAKLPADNNNIRPHLLVVSGENSAGREAEPSLTLNVERPTSNIKHRMRILMISAEGPPLQRAGALIDVMDALPRELRKRGHSVSVTLPYHREIRENSEFKAKRTGIAVDVRVGDKTYVAEYFEGRSAGRVQLFLVRCDEFFDRAGIYGEHGQPYEDNAARFIFFCKAALELARRLTPSLQILHVHDWAAALVPVFVRAHDLPFATVLTIHHVADQGSFWGLDFNLTNLPARFFTLDGVEFFGRLNFLKGGILYANKITTVSEHYRREIQTPAGGHGLDVVCAKMRIG